MVEYPGFAHMLCDQYGFIGMVSNLSYCQDTDIYTIIIDWYIDGQTYSEPTRVGRVKSNDDIDFISFSEYSELRSRYRELKKGILNVTVTNRTTNT